VKCSRQFTTFDDHAPGHFGLLLKHNGPRFLKAIAIVLTVAFGLVAFVPLAEAVGFQQLSIPDAADRPLLIGIWYPSETPVQLRPLELYAQEVAPDGTISGDRLPLIVMSHGTGESLSAHYHTAIALAAAGFVVAIVTHTDDNYQDRSYAFTQRNFVEYAAFSLKNGEYEVPAERGITEEDVKEMAEKLNPPSTKQ
jgi:hypothetical protein